MSRWLKNIGLVIKNSAIAILEGKLLLRMHINRFYVHILCLFLVLAAVIWVSLAIDNTLAGVEQAKKELHALQIKKSELRFELTDLTRRESVETNLKKMGSPLIAPRETATRIK